MPHVYVPLRQNAWWRASLIVRPEGGAAAALAGPVRAAVARVDREVAVARVRTMATIADDAMSRPRFRALLVGAFAALALTLATVGIFGVLAQLVQQRMREFGVRIALGASRRNVIGLVLGHATRITLAGLIAGLALAAMLGRLMATLIYPVTPLDPLTFVVVPIVAALTAAVACVAPAWRATSRRSGDGVPGGLNRSPGVGSLLGTPPRRGLGPGWFAEGLHGDALITHLEDLQLLRAARRVKDHAVAWSGLHQRARQRRQPADVVAIQIDLVERRRCSPPALFQRRWRSARSLRRRPASPPAHFSGLPGPPLPRHRSVS